MKIVRRKFTNAHVSWRAVIALWSEEFSFKLQTVFGFAVIILAFLLGLSRIEVVVVILMIGAVLAVEALNTAIEELCDHVTPEVHPKIGKIKDLGSAASLLIGVAAIIVGLIIFIPHLI
jgi:diacylglycerol kinase